MQGGLIPPQLNGGPTILNCNDCYTPTVLTITNNYLIIDNYVLLLVDATLGDITISLPDAAGFFVGGKSAVWNVKKINTTGGDVIVATTVVGQTLDGDTSVRLRGRRMPEIGIVTDGADFFIAK